MIYRAYAIVAVVLILALSAVGCSDDDDPSPSAPECEFEIVTRTIASDQFIRNRFFRLNSGREIPGLDADLHLIDPNSIHVFRRLPQGPFGPGDLAYLAVYPDSNGDWSGIDFQEPHDYGDRWRELPFELVREDDGSVRALDLRATTILDADLLGVTYTVIDRTGQVAYQVGDNPRAVPPVREIAGDPGRLYYGMKLLKAPLDHAEPVSFAYEFRTVYDLGWRQTIPEWISVWVEQSSRGVVDPSRDEQGMPYLRIFGLDRESTDGRPVPDGIADFHRVEIFDLRRGLLIFPEDFPQPFAGSPDQYTAYVNDPVWVWDPDSYLANNLAPELYSAFTPPQELPIYSRFRIIVELRMPVVK